MAKRSEPVNPFYVGLVIVGTAFTITACAYGLMSLRALATRPVPGEGNHALMAFLDRHGREIMVAEIVVLALCAFAAMGLDRLRQRRSEGLETRPTGFQGGPSKNRDQDEDLPPG